LCLLLLCYFNNEKPFPLKLDDKYFADLTVKIRKTLFKNTVAVTEFPRLSFFAPEKLHNSYTNYAFSLS